nr:NAD(+)/NADH kinase [Candidatus Sigynarchaeota archaeon]
MKLAELAESQRAVAIASRLDAPKAIQVTKELASYLLEQRIKVIAEARIANILGLQGKPLYEMNKDDVPVVICVGGDGTILRVAQKLPYRNPPGILGVNVGAVGFLAEFDVATKEAFPQLFTTDLYEERCLRLSCFIEEGSSSQGPYNSYNSHGSHQQHVPIPPALNEILVITSRPSKALSITIRVNGKVFSTGYVDGIIISTPTGSTAYSLSAGGSIMSPDIDAIQIVPVCPFARTGLKPLIVKPDSTIEIELLRPKLNAVVAIDGQQEIVLSSARKVTIKKSTSSITLYRSERSSFFSRLNRKLLPGAKFPVPKHDVEIEP